MKKAGPPDIILGDLNIPAFPEEEEGDWSESLFGTIDDTAVHITRMAEELKYPKMGTHTITIKVMNPLEIG